MASKPIKVLVTGAGGQLGREIMGLTVAGVEFVGKDRDALDITDAAACASVIGELKPDAVIHAAAYTAVDRAETEPDLAYLVNVNGTRNVATAAEYVGAKLLYVSTDYVFDGTSSRPYRIEDPTGPRTVYGRTKLEGEQAALAACSRAFVVRTSWVYGRHGANFVHTMMKLAGEGRPLTVVNDQTGSPTHTRDLAQFLAELVRTDRYGTYHASNAGLCTWYQFAQAIFEESGLDADLTPCTTDRFPRPAARPAYSVLDGTALVEAGFVPLRHWRDALRAFLQTK